MKDKTAQPLLTFYDCTWQQLVSQGAVGSKYDEKMRIKIENEI